MGSSRQRRELHLKVLSLFGAITRLDIDYPLRRQTLRQTVCPNDKRKDWFAVVFSSAKRYILESAVMVA